MQLEENGNGMELQIICNVYKYTPCLKINELKGWEIIRWINEVFGCRKT
jgi:hypothetical protein